jgi:hypothetical protein
MNESGLTLVQVHSSIFVISFLPLSFYQNKRILKVASNKVVKHKKTYSDNKHVFLFQTRLKAHITQRLNIR